MTKWEIEQGFKPKQAEPEVVDLAWMVKANREEYNELVDAEFLSEFESEEFNEDIQRKKFILNLELEELVG